MNLAELPWLTVMARIQPSAITGQKNSPRWRNAAMAMRRWLSKRCSRKNIVNNKSEKMFLAAKDGAELHPPSENAARKIVPAAPEFGARKKTQAKVTK